MFTLEILQELWPHGDARAPGLVEGIAAAAPTVFPKYGLTNDLLVAHAMAQFSHECGAGMEMTESIRYTAKRACEVWPSRFKTVAEPLQDSGGMLRQGRIVRRRSQFSGQADRQCLRQPPRQQTGHA